MADDDQTKAPSAEQQQEAADAAQQAAEGVGSDDAVPPIDFNTFVISMSASAAMHLGLAPNPATGKTEVSLPLARQTIDLLTLLEDKTRGNLTGEEERLLAQILYDLRMQFVSRAKEQK